jgi:hypothetical protein
MATNRPVCLASFVHPLLRARDWQDRPEYGQVCHWWRAGGTGVLALVGIGGAGKTAIADRFVRSLPGITEAELQLPHDVTLPVPDGLFVFSFYEAPNPEYFFDTLYDWLVSAFQLVDRRRVAPTHSAGIRMQASASLVIDALGLTQRRLLLVFRRPRKSTTRWLAHRCLRTHRRWWPSGVPRARSWRDTARSGSDGEHTLRAG